MLSSDSSASGSASGNICLLISFPTFSLRPLRVFASPKKLWRNFYSIHVLLPSPCPNILEVSELRQHSFKSVKTQNSLPLFAISLFFRSRNGAWSSASNARPAQKYYWIYCWLVPLWITKRSGTRLGCLAFTRWVKWYKAGRKRDPHVEVHRAEKFSFSDLMIILSENGWLSHRKAKA